MENAAVAVLPSDVLPVRLVQRTVHVRLQLDPPLWTRLTDLSWQAARYRNLFLRALWAEAMHLRVAPDLDDGHGVSKSTTAS